MGPDVDHLIVLLKEAEEVVAPLMPRRAVASVDVRLPEELGHVGFWDSARHLGKPFFQNLGQPAQLLPAHRQGAQAFQDGSRHGSGGPGSTGLSRRSFVEFNVCSVVGLWQKSAVHVPAEAHDDPEGLCKQGGWVDWETGYFKYFSQGLRNF